MNKAYIACLIFGPLLMPTAASAAGLVQFPSGLAAWVVDVTPSPSSTGAPPAAAGRKHVVKIEVTQDDHKRRSVIHWSDGQTTEKWDIPGMNLIMAEDSTGHAFSVLGGSMGARIIEIPFVPSAFSWLKPELLQEKDPISYQNKQCFHYKGGSEAWIDSTTLLPVALDDRTSLGVYTFQKDPPPPFTLPAKYQNIFNRFEEGMGVMKHTSP